MNLNESKNDNLRSETPASLVSLVFTVKALQHTDTQIKHNKMTEILSNVLNTADNKKVA